MKNSAPSSANGLMLILRRPPLRTETARKVSNGSKSWMKVSSRCGTTSRHAPRDSPAAIGADIKRKFGACQLVLTMKRSPTCSIWYSWSRVPGRNTANSSAGSSAFA